MSNQDFAAVVTSFHVERWDAGQIGWVLDRLGQDGHPRAWAGRNVTIRPETFRSLGVEPYEVTHDYNCNQIVQAGWVALLGGIAGTSIGTKFSATAGRIGIGTSTTAATYTQTTLVGDTGSGSTTSYFKLVSSAPTIVTASSPPTLTFAATFGTSVANFAWNEFGTDNGSADSVSNSVTGGTFINRGVSNQGTKPNTQIWSATEILTFGVPTGAGTVS